MKHRRRVVVLKSNTSSRLLSAIETLILLQTGHLENEASHRKNLSDLKALKEAQVGLDQKYLEHLATVRNKEEIRHQWESEILSCDRSFFEPPPTGTLQAILQKPFWLETQYEKAYPKAFAFLSQAVQSAQSRLSTCKVTFYNPWLASPNAGSRLGGLESVVPRRSRNEEERRSIADQLWFVVTAGDGAQAPRTICIQDMSPSVGAVLMATTPRSVVSNLCPFLERYLAFENFGKASLLSIRAEPPDSMNCFIFEYHFAFYYVTKQFAERNMMKYDSRRLRNSSCFGGDRSDSNSRVRHIHEEQMSFFLAGDGTGKYYCYQLGERYFKPDLSNEERNCVYSPGWTPSILFLSWIAMALHHVGIRWQNAIEAVDALVDSEKEVVFHKKNSFDLDQRAKERKIEQLRTYFWVLEAYKLFEDSLTKTVEAWEQFQRMSLNRVNDGRNDDEFDVSVELIERSIDRLRKKIEWVRRKTEQVCRLREGLGFAAQMSDTSVAIGQNDNIRLLTYFNIFFLPLSLSATLFSMQFLQGTQWQAFVGVAALMTLTTVIAVLLITHKVQDLASVVGRLLPRYKGAIQQAVVDKVSGMVQEAEPLAEPENWQAELAPKLDILSSFAIIAKFYFVTLPVTEIRATLNLYGFFNSSTGPTSQDDEASSLEIISMYRHNTGGESQIGLLPTRTVSGPGSLGPSQLPATGATGQSPAPNGRDADIQSNNLNPRTLASQVQEAMANWSSLRPTRTRKPPRATRTLQHGFSIAGRACITIILWTPLVLLEYIFLLIWGGFRQWCLKCTDDPEARRDALGLRLDPGTAEKNASLLLNRFFSYPLTVLLPSGSVGDRRRRARGHRNQASAESSQRDLGHQGGRQSHAFRELVELHMPSRQAQAHPGRSPFDSEGRSGLGQSQQQQQQQQKKKKKHPTWGPITVPVPAHSWSSRTPSPLGRSRNPSPNPNWSRLPQTPNPPVGGIPTTASPAIAGEGRNTTPSEIFPAMVSGGVRAPTRVATHRRAYSDVET